MKPNILIFRDKEYNAEMLWRDGKDDKNRDSKGELFPYPIESKTLWSEKSLFLDRMKLVMNYLDIEKKYQVYDEKKDCLICKKKDIITKRYQYSNTIWEDGIIHYIDEHNIEPSIEFRKFIYNKNTIPNEELLKRQKTNTSTTSTDNNKKHMMLERIIRNNKQYVMIDRNQLLILDALMIHGGYAKKYFDPEKDITRYSEHAGLLDFEEDTLNKIVVSGKTNRVDTEDEEIFLPANLDEMLDYEYIFHTHPPTPKPGGRSKEGILYEFPSIGDIYHFIDHHNDGNVIGSLVITPEGLYNIRKFNNDTKEIIVDDDDLYKKYFKTFDKVQNSAVKKYGHNFTENKFYSKIAQDKTYIALLNETLNEFNIQIDYYPRKQDKDGKWHIDTLFLVFRNSGRNRQNKHSNKQLHKQNKQNKQIKKSKKTKK